MSEELKPCAHCGGEAQVIGDDKYGYYVCCFTANCFCAVGECYDRNAMPDHQFRQPEDAIAAWNTRSDGWRRIENCPPDTAVMLYANGYYIGHRNSTNGLWWTSTDGTGTAEERQLNSWAPPTHFQLLSAPPEEQK